MNGQARRAWLDGIDVQIGEGLRYFLGGTGLDARINALASAGQMALGGSDYVDSYEASGNLMQNPSFGNALALVPPVAAMMMPGISNRMIEGTADVGRGFVNRMMQPGEMPVLGSNGGNVLRLFHGSPRNDLNALDPSMTGRGALGPGVYGTPFKHVAERYAGDGGRVYDFEAANIFNGIGRTGVQGDVNYFQQWRDQTAMLVDAAPDDQKSMVAEVVSKLNADDGYALLRDLAYRMGSKEAAHELFRKAGFSGISGHVDGPEVLIFDKVPLGIRDNALAKQPYVVGRDGPLPPPRPVQ